MYNLLGYKFRLLSHSDISIQDIKKKYIWGFVKKYDVIPRLQSCDRRGFSFTKNDLTRARK